MNSIALHGIVTPLYERLSQHPTGASPANSELEKAEDDGPARARKPKFEIWAELCGDPRRLGVEHWLRSIVTGPGELERAKQYPPEEAYAAGASRQPRRSKQPEGGEGPNEA